MNTLSDLNSCLFEQLSRLNNSELKGDALKEEIERSKAVKDISTQVVSNARLALDAKNIQLEYGLTTMPAMLSDQS